MGICPNNNVIITSKRCHTKTETNFIDFSQSPKHAISSKTVHWHDDFQYFFVYSSFQKLLLWLQCTLVFYSDIRKINIMLLFFHSICLLIALYKMKMQSVVTSANSEALLRFNVNSVTLPPKSQVWYSLAWFAKYAMQFCFHNFHYNDVILGAIASQITSLAIVYSKVYSSVDQRKHQSSASLAFVWGIHRWPVNSPHKWPATRKMFLFDDVIMFWDWLDSFLGDQ